MKKQFHAKFLKAAVAVLFLLGAFNSMFAQKGIGAKYGSRDPQTCADTKAPTSGAMTTALAIKYVICAQEQVQGDSLYLVEDLTLQLGGAVPYNARNFPYAHDIDPKAPVYPLRASFKQYQCSAISEIMENKGYNCNIYPRPKATGVCLKTTFGDWDCNITSADLDVSQSEHNMPPPGGAKAVANDKPTAANNGNQTADNQGTANGDENGLPTPDFSEMEKYFDISKIEYADGYLYFNGKMTKKNNAVDWHIDFYDEDGIKVIPTNGINPKSGDYEQVGDIAKYYGYLPPESKWKFVKKVVIARTIH